LLFETNNEKFRFKEVENKKISGHSEGNLSQSILGVGVSGRYFSQSNEDGMKRKVEMKDE